MPILIASDEARGKIIRKDEREDGTEIWLVCEEADGPQRGTGLPVDEDDEWYPLVARSDEQVPVLIVDTSRLRRGTMLCRMPAFVAQVMTLLSAGASEAEVTDENAHEWGGTDRELPRSAS